MLSEPAARAAIVSAFVAEMGREPSLEEAQALQAVARGESSYGAGWKTPEGKASNNWGAVHYPSEKPVSEGGEGCTPGVSFENPETHPDGTPYQQCMRVYDSPAEGARHVVRLLFTSNRAKKAGTPAAFASGSLRRVSASMYDQVYYTGVCETREECIQWHMRLLERQLEIITEALDEPLTVRRDTGSGGPGAGGAGASGLVVLGLAGLGLFLLSKKRG